MANGERLYTVKAFSNAPEHAPTGGAVYIVTDLTEAQKDALVAREEEQHPDRWLIADVQD
ncbi:hypothetical protein [Streptomyces sp. NPDC021020]|uniref:hypothetical protein n=1 Tax=Streptomyces sp. NPDC021020 TaxID=3365109 RepID=UPI0037B783BB